MESTDARFLDPVGRVRQLPWGEAAREVVLEGCSPLAAFPVRPGRRVAPGWWWSATCGRLVAYGSGLMRTQVMLMDRDPGVVALACRPVELVWSERGTVVGHAPQVMARLADGSGLLVDCVGREGPSARLAARAAVVAAAVRAVGWRYRLAGPGDPVVVANVRWLAGYRHPRYGAGGPLSDVLGAFDRPRSAVEGVRSVGDPIAVWPVLFHALWRGLLQARLDVPLHERVVVSASLGEGCVG
ncbi:TnsA-like heteromeric transposase endonuclease subunit [Kitasatospora sp. NPDC093102]|uniref:TnsA-like heteromeric transposase endonuclease subunit n=1 Tax=Kitasatospora sp. NPDC093102 TaxID=3155069 RepID=UPI0034406B24